MSEVQPVLAQIFPTHLRGSFCDAPRELIQEEEAEAGEGEKADKDNDKDKAKDEEGIYPVFVPSCPRNKKFRRGGEGIRGGDFLGEASACGWCCAMNEQKMGTVV